MKNLIYIIPYTRRIHNIYFNKKPYENHKVQGQNLCLTIKLGRIGTPNSYATKYVATITVGADGVIIAAAQDANGLGGSTFAVVPATGADANNGIIDWVRSDGNTYNGIVTADNMDCDDNELC